MSFRFSLDGCVTGLRFSWEFEIGRRQMDVGRNQLAPDSGSVV
ncbi:hypothetical protein RISK_004972 [Rhodopirellula islandica]|uniref:Uncharacterized protein n=1 Tax=Rhodopirellula islandica TaxID=595434 RepID=A0A0J1B8F4_RHOIS|nr:hypothetical protein RISK_004972 [Rhodopirellula islandica]